MQPAPKSQLLELLREEIRKRHYSYRTEKQYVGWVVRFIEFHHGQHPKALGGPEVEAFLSHLATVRDVAAATQAQALAALLFLYKRVLGLDLPWLGNVTRAKRPKRLPVVLTREEARRVIERLRGPYRVIASLLYGSGLRLLEALRLRVKAALPSPRICSRAARTSAPCRNSWVTPASRPRRSTHTS
jgi:integrase